VGDNPVVVTCYAEVVADMIAAGDLDGGGTREVDRRRAKCVHGP
jgi:hypothetical protein